MKAGKVKKQSSRNSRTNSSHTLEGKKTKPTNKHTVTRKHTAAAKINILQQGASLLVKLKKSGDSPVVAYE